MKRSLGVNTDKAWVAGWLASLTYRDNPYTRADYRRAFIAGKQAGFRQNKADVAALNRRLERNPALTRLPPI